MYYAGLTPQELFLITSVETLKVVADPLRLQILARLRDQPLAAKQIAQALHVPLKKLYYHLNLLEEHGLIRVANTRIVSGIIEKHYRVSAYRFSVERSLISPQAPDEPGGLDAFLSLILDHVQAEIRRSVRAGLLNLTDLAEEQHGVFLGRQWVSMTPEEAEAYSAGFKAFHNQFVAALPSTRATPVRRYELLTGLYPVLPDESSNDTVTH